MKVWRDSKILSCQNRKTNSMQAKWRSLFLIDSRTNVLLCRKDTSTLDAACSGAFSAISVVLGIIANLIAFISCVALLNSVLGWLGYLIGLDFLSFEWIISKLFFPVAFTLGIPYEECDTIAQLIALKTVVNEFVAYERLGSLKKNKTISLRSSAIVTFAMCGFANPGSLGVLMGAMNSMCPEIRPITVKVSIRAFIAGCIVCLINASVAGLFTAVDGASRSNSIKSSVTQNSSWSGIPRWNSDCLRIQNGRRPRQ